MAHPLETAIRNAGTFLLIGDSSKGRFPAQSFHNYTAIGRKFYCIDLGGLTESRGGTKGAKVYTEVSELPDDLDDLAIIWTKPRDAKRAVELAHEAGSKRVWFSFQCGHREAVERAIELEMEVVEIGRCPVHYLEDQVPACRAHTIALKVAGGYKKPPQLDPTAKRRELI